MTIQLSKEWLERRAEQEDGGYVCAGSESVFEESLKNMRGNQGEITQGDITDND